MRHLRRITLSLFLLAALAVSPGQGAAQECVDINTATAAQLDRIIHIGPARAEQVIQLRAQRRFATVDELVRVRGIAAARLRDIKAQGIACVRESERLADELRSPSLRHPASWRRLTRTWIPSFGTSFSGVILPFAGAQR